MSGWHPIKTAPKDGTRMLLWHRMWTGEKIGYWDTETEWWRIGDETHWYGVGIFPSAWHPLPKIPWWVRLAGRTFGHNEPDGFISAGIPYQGHQP